MFAKRQVFAMLLAWCFMGFAASADTVVLVKKDNIGVYRNQIRKLFEPPVFTVSMQDRLLVLETKDDRFRIRNREGREGWIERSLCIRAPRGTRFVFDPLELLSFHPQLNPALVFGSDDQPEERLFLERSFKEELLTNTDRESMERQTR